MHATEARKLTNDTLPNYQVGEFGNAASATNWLNQMGKEGYRLITMIPVSATNHFSKETETMVWFVTERQAASAGDE